MTGVCIEKIIYNGCKKQGQQVCSKPSVQVFANDDGTTTGFCFSCAEYIPDPYGDGRKVKLPEPPSEEDVQATLAEISSYPTVGVPHRMLNEKNLEDWGIKTSISEEDGETPTAFYCPVYKERNVISGYYVKTIPKDKGKSFVYAIGDVKNCKPIGWYKALDTGAHTLIITEGFIDAVSVDKIFKHYQTNNDFFPAIVSLPNGVNSIKSFAGLQSDLKQFKRVVACFDNDEPGQNAVKKIADIIPGIESVVLPRKDANDCLIEGVGKVAFKALSFNTSKPKNSRLVRGRDIHEKARTPAKPGELSWPFPSMNVLTRRIRLGETIYIGAGVKMGKSELLNALAEHHLMQDGVPVLVAKPEETTELTYKMMVNKVAGSVFHDPDVPFDEEAYDLAGQYLADKLVMIDLYQHLGWETLKQDIASAVHEDGVKAVFIDPITNLTNGLNAADANTKLQEISQELAVMAKDLNIVVYIFCHLKAPDGRLSEEVRNKYYNQGKFIGLGNCQHERGGSVASTQFTGSRAMMRSCHLMIGLEGNKDPELPDEERNRRDLVILEDRMFGNAARVSLKWDPETTRFEQI